MVILVGATAGATLVFLAARYVFGDVARRRLGEPGRKLVDGFDENALSYLLFLRLAPLFPFWLVNLAPAFTRIKAPSPFSPRLLRKGWAGHIAPACKDLVPGSD